MWMQIDEKEDDNNNNYNNNNDHQQQQQQHNVRKVNSVRRKRWKEAKGCKVKKETKRAREKERRQAHAPCWPPRVRRSGWGEGAPLFTSTIRRIRSTRKTTRGNDTHDQCTRLRGGSVFSTVCSVSMLAFPFSAWTPRQPRQERTKKKGSGIERGSYNERPKLEANEPKIRGASGAAYRMALRSAPRCATPVGLHRLSSSRLVSSRRRSSLFAPFRPSSFYRVSRSSHTSVYYLTLLLASLSLLPSRDSLNPFFRV